MDQKPRILTIDDEEAVRRSIRFYLEDSDYEVIEATNGREGLNTIREETPDLILCDLRMPEIGGLEVLATVTSELPNVPIIIVSGTGVLGDAIEAVRLGAWDYVLKPIQDMGVLEISVKRALERARLRQEIEKYHQHLETEILCRTEELRASETKFRTVIECLSEGVIITDSDDRMLFVNGKLAEMCGYDVGEMVGKPTDIVLTEQTRAMMRSDEDDQSRGMPQTYEIQLRRKNGEIFWAEISAGPYPNPDGQIIGSLAIIRDISERKRAEAEKEKLEAQLRCAQKLETIGTLAGGVAHDFNNILTPIMGYSEMIRDSLDTTAPARNDIDQVIAAAFRARDLVRQILAFSRQSEEERKEVVIQDVIGEALKLVRASIPSTIDIRDRTDSPGCVVNCDPTQIHQVMMNLCMNAFHAIKENGGVLEIAISEVFADAEFSSLHMKLKAGHYVRITVSDTGHGMDRATMERIFEPFFTTKVVGEGTGLGLSVVHGIVTAHGGGISVYSEPGHGTTFQIYLPCSSRLVSEQEFDGADDLQGGSERILFVDDEPSNTRMAEQILSSLGYKVVTCTDSTEALTLALAESCSFDLIITDQTMPHVTGTELALHVRQARPDMPIILVTGFSEKVTSCNYHELGFCAYLMKPLIKRELASVVRKALGDTTVLPK